MDINVDEKALTFNIYRCEPDDVVLRSYVENIEPFSVNVGVLQFTSTIGTVEVSPFVVDNLNLSDTDYIIIDKVKLQVGIAVKFQPTL